LRLESMGLRVDVVTRYAGNELGLQIPADTAVSPALSLAARRLAARPTPFEFLPPRVTGWQQVAARYSSRKLRAVGAATALLLLMVGGMFGFQQLQLMRLGSQWSSMAARVKELEKVTEQIHQFRPWYDESARALVILRQLTQAFPETGVVTAKTVEIRELNAVTCTGVARDNQELAKTMDRLSATAGISDFHRGPIRGKSPIQFTFDYRWSEGGKREN
jgi:hypothetical protein